MTNHERDVLELLAQRKSNKNIAAELMISAATVKNHAHNICQKLNVRGRRQAVSEALKIGFFSQD